MRAMNQVVFEPLQHAQSWTLPVYRKFGGYEAWEKILREKLDVVLKEKNAVLTKVYGRLPLEAERIVEDYRARPQTESEVGWSDLATIGMIADEPW